VKFIIQILIIQNRCYVKVEKINNITKFKIQNILPSKNMVFLFCRIWHWDPKGNKKGTRVNGNDLRQRRLMYKLVICFFYILSLRPKIIGYNKDRNAYWYSLCIICCNFVGKSHHQNPNCNLTSCMQIWMSRIWSLHQYIINMFPARHKLFANLY